VRVLFLSPYLPSRIRVRPYYWVRSLVELGHEVHLVALKPPEDASTPEDDMRRVCTGIDVFPLSRQRTLANVLVTVARRSTPLQLAYSHHAEAEARVAELAASGRFDVVHVEHMRGVALASLVRDVPIIYDAVDSISALFAETARQAPSSVARLVARLDLRRSQRFEAHAPFRFARVLVTSEKEADAFVVLGGPAARAKLVVVPNGVDTGYFRPGENRDPRAVVFTGKLSYHANAAAALRLVQRIMPLIWRNRPETPVTIAGKDPPAAVQALAADRRVTVTGYVDDMRTVFANAAIAVCPLVYGAGIQNKALEAMSSGVPTVITADVGRALSGRAGETYAVSSDDSGIAAAVLEVYARPDWARALGAAGRQYVLQCHDWRAMCAALVREYQSTARAPGMSR
jgi:glycosyltransferase involved in cell wall biosynthesis